jgi:hypothetical protein
MASTGRDRMSSQSGSPEGVGKVDARLAYLWWKDGGRGSEGIEGRRDLGCGQQCGDERTIAVRYAKDTGETVHALARTQ